MNKSRNIFLILIIINLIFITGVQAQTGDRIYQDFRNLGIYMAKVWELVQQFNDQKAVEFMALAKIEFDKARFLLYNTTPRIELAKIPMAKAKYYTDRAARLVLSKPILNLKSQLNDLITRAEKAVSVSNSDEANYLLNQAKKFRGLAYYAFNNRQTGKGEEFYRISFFFGRKCLDYVKNSTTDLSEMYNNLDLSVKQLLAQAEELISDGEHRQLENLLREAENHYQEAVILAEEGRLQMAVSRLRLIKRLLYRVFDQAERTVLTDSGRLEYSMYSLRRLLESLQDEVSQTTDQRMKSLMDKAWELYRAAEMEYQNGNYAKSQGKISLCQRFANRLFRLTKNRNAGEGIDLEEELRETRNVLSLQEDRLKDLNRKDLNRLHQEANRMLDRAQQALSSDRNGVAFQLIQGATRMSARIQRELRTSSNIIEKQTLERIYQQVNNSITSLENNENIIREHNAIINQLKSFSEKGKQYLDEGNYLLADEYLNTAWEQIRQYTNIWRK